MAARKRASIDALPPPEKSKIHIGTFFSKWGPFFFIEACPSYKNSVGVHGREQTRCGYCNKGHTNTWCIKCNIHLCFTETRNCIIIDVLNEGMLNDINNIFNAVRKYSFINYAILLSFIYKNIDIY